MKKRIIQYKAKCPICNKVNVIEINVHNLMLYKSGLGKVQDLFPDLSENERELILTGVCDTCWNALFKDIIVNTNESEENENDR